MYSGTTKTKASNPATVSAQRRASTRTIYNHFRDKAALSEEVIRESATRVADGQVAEAERRLTRPDDLTDALLGYARSLAVPDAGVAEHFALVRQINAEVGHIPAAIVEGRQDTAPRRVQAALRAAMAALMDAGRLRAADPERAARHLMGPAAAEITSRSFHGALPLPPAEVDRIVTTGVDAFLRAYAP